MESKQLNVRVPLFVHDELANLRTSLREIGCKPTDGDLVAALIHAAMAAVDETKSVVETYVMHELVQEQQSGSAEP